MAEQEQQKSEKKVSLRFKKTYPKRLVSVIVNNNGAELEETEDQYIISAPYIKVTRDEAESAIGKLSESKWRLLFMGRSEDKVKHFDSSMFAFGNQRPVTSKEDMTQINFSLPKTLKADITLYRSEKYLNLGQNEFLIEATREYIENIKRETGE